MSRPIAWRALLSRSARGASCASVAGPECARDVDGESTSGLYSPARLKRWRPQRQERTVFENSAVRAIGVGVGINSAPRLVASRFDPLWVQLLLGVKAV